MKIIVMQKLQPINRRLEPNRLSSQTFDIKDWIKINYFSLKGRHRITQKDPRIQHVQATPSKTWFSQVQRGKIRI